MSFELAIDDFAVYYYLINDGSTHNSISHHRYKFFLGSISHAHHKHKFAVFWIYIMHVNVSEKEYCNSLIK